MKGKKKKGSYIALIALTLQEAPGLPKTRSGKIMRRILRKVATREFESLGDVSTLADPMVVAELIASVTANPQ